AVRWDGRRVLFLGAIDLGRDKETMPVDELGRVGVVVDGDGGRLAFLHTQDWTGRGAVVADGGKDAVWGQFDHDGSDAKIDIRRDGCGWGRLLGRLLVWAHAGQHDNLGRQITAEGPRGERGGCEFEEIAAIHSAGASVRSVS